MSSWPRWRTPGTQRARRLLGAATVVLLLALATGTSAYVWMTRTRFEAWPPTGRSHAEAAPGASSAATPANAATGGTTAPVQRKPCKGRAVSPASDVHAVVAAAGDGATLCFRAGVYRVTTPIAPRDRQTLQAEPGTVINGSSILNGFRRVGRVWAMRGLLPKNPKRYGECRPRTYLGCQYGEAVFYDGEPLWRVMSLGEVGPGRFYQDYGNNKVWVGDDPAGHTVEQAVAEDLINSQAAAVTIRGFVLEKAKMSGIQSGDNEGWVIEGNEARLNHAIGIDTGLHAPRSVVRNNHAHHNGNVGIGGGGSDTLVEHNQLDHNNTMGFDQFWSAGGGKWVWSTRLTLRGNYVHDNAGPGLWTDIDNRFTVIEGNRVVNNAGPGIFHEISYDAKIRANTVIRNAFDQIYDDWYVGAGICVAESSNVEVYDNTVAGNANGITLVMQERGGGRHGRYEARNGYVYDNTIIMTEGSTGLANNTGDSVYWADRNNRFEGNTYMVDSLSAARWLWEGNRARTKDEWTALGNDRNGLFDTL